MSVRVDAFAITVDLPIRYLDRVSQVWRLETRKKLKAKWPLFCRNLSSFGIHLDARQSWEGQDYGGVEGLAVLEAETKDMGRVTAGVIIFLIVM